jgi:RNA polymerase sigma factor (TIGR02999 family)
MSEVTRILSAIEQGDPSAAEQLLPLVYDELRKLAGQKLAHEKPGQTLDATALVHEAYLRLVQRGEEDVDGGRAPGPRAFADRRHFFLAAAEGMRRILIEKARAKKSLKRGGDRQRVDLFEDQLIGAAPDEQLVALDEALAHLEQEQPRMAQLVKLHFFAGLTLEQAAQSLDISLRTAKRDWTFARAWLRREMDRDK